MKKILDMMSDLPDELIEEAEKKPERKIGGWIEGAAIAASVVLIFASALIGAPGRGAGEGKESAVGTVTEETETKTETETEMSVPETSPAENGVPEGAFRWTSVFTEEAFEEKSVALPEFPGVTFTLAKGGEILYAEKDGEREKLCSGMPVAEVFFCDLNGDGNREICSMLCIGSGMIDERVVIVDYAGRIAFEFSDRGTFDYNLRLEGEKLIAEKYAYGAHFTYPLDDKPPVESGELSYIPEKMTDARFPTVWFGDNVAQYWFLPYTPDKTQTMSAAELIAGTEVTSAEMSAYNMNAIHRLGEADAEKLEKLMSYLRSLQLTNEPVENPYLPGGPEWDVVLTRANGSVTWVSLIGNSYFRAGKDGPWYRIVSGQTLKLEELLGLDLGK